MGARIDHAIALIWGSALTIWAFVAIDLFGRATPLFDWLERWQSLLAGFVGGGFAVIAGRYALHAARIALDDVVGHRTIEESRQKVWRMRAVAQGLLGVCTHYSMIIAWLKADLKYDGNRLDIKYRIDCAAEALDEMTKISFQDEIAGTILHDAIRGARNSIKSIKHELIIAENITGILEGEGLKGCFLYAKEANFYIRRLLATAQKMSSTMRKQQRYRTFELDLRAVRIDLRWALGFLMRARIRKWGFVR